MATTEATRAGEFLLSEANGTRSRESVTVTGGSYPAGQVLGKVTASGKYATTAMPPTAPKSQPACFMTR